MDQLGQILDERRRSSSQSNNDDGAPLPQSSPRNRSIPQGPESASDDDDDSEAELSEYELPGAPK